jgi:hypothetical protein
MIQHKGRRVDLEEDKEYSRGFLVVIGIQFRSG